MSYCTVCKICKQHNCHRGFINKLTCAVKYSLEHLLALQPQINAYDYRRCHEKQEEACTKAERRKCSKKKLVQLYRFSGW